MVRLLYKLKVSIRVVNYKEMEEDFINLENKNTQAISLPEIFVAKKRGKASFFWKISVF